MVSYLYRANDNDDDDGGVDTLSFAISNSTNDIVYMHK